MVTGDMVVPSGARTGLWGRPMGQRASGEVDPFAQALADPSAAACLVVRACRMLALPACESGSSWACPE